MRNVQLPVVMIIIGTLAAEIILFMGENENMETTACAVIGATIISCAIVILITTAQKIKLWKE